MDTIRIPARVRCRRAFYRRTFVLLFGLVCLFLWYNCRPSTEYPDKVGYQVAIMICLLVVLIVLLDAIDTQAKYGLRPNNDYHTV